MGSTGSVSNESNSLLGFYGFQDLYNRYPTEIMEWFSDNSNITDWVNNLSPEELGIIQEYVGTGYGAINSRQYNVPWEQMSGVWKKKISDLYHAINKFELNEGITVDRACNFQVFGANAGETMTVKQVQDFLRQSDGFMQNDGFMSFSTREDGHPVGKNHGVVIKLRVPPSKGAGAYIGSVSKLSGEQEFLVNNNAVLKYDINSVHKSKDGKIIVYADWIGRSQAQTISPTYTGTLKPQSSKPKKAKTNWFKKFLFND